MRSPLVTEIILVVLQGVARVEARTEAALRGKLGDGLLDGQVAGGRAGRYGHAAVRAGGRLVAQPRVRQQMSKTRRAHKMPICALQGKRTASAFNNYGYSSNRHRDKLEVL